jgi:pimeloyl-[acyl-carrier protein] methyl ester esterase
MPWFESRRGERLWYEDAGAGCPVVLLHGWCMSAAVWQFQFDNLAGSMRLIAPDLRGHGHSHGVSGPLDFARLGEDLADLCERLELTEVILVGWSLGGQIALHAHAALAGRLAGLALVGTTPCFTATADFPFGLATSEAAGMRLKVQRNLQRARDGFLTRLFTAGELAEHPEAAQIAALLAAIPLPDSAAALAALDALAGTDMRGLLAAVTVPVLVMNGALDKICLPDASRYLHEHLPSSAQTVFPHCGHAPFLTHSRQFNTELERFIRSIRGPNA